MVSCSVGGCRNSTRFSKHSRSMKDGKIIVFHSFPSRDKSPLRHKAWLKRTKHIGGDVSNSRICSAHFTDADFEPSISLMQQFGLGSSKVRSQDFKLKKTAVPSQLLHDQSTLAKKTRKLSAYQRKKIVEEAMSEAYSKKDTKVMLVEVHHDVNICEGEDTSENDFQTEDKSSVLNNILKQGQSCVSENDKMTYHLNAEGDTKPFIQTGLESSTELRPPLEAENEMGIQCELGKEQYRACVASSSV